MGLFSFRLRERSFGDIVEGFDLVSLQLQGHKALALIPAWKIIQAEDRRVLGIILQVTVRADGL